MEELQILRRKLEEMKEKFLSDHTSFLNEISDHEDYLRRHDLQMQQRMEDHVSFVQDTIETNATLHGIFVELQKRHGG